LALKRLAKKLGRFLAGFFRGFDAVVDEVGDNGWKGEVTSNSAGGSLGDGQKVDCTGDVRLVEAVVREASVETVLIESASDCLLR